jgi:hypothetical protein
MSLPLFALMLKVWRERRRKKVRQHFFYSHTKLLF